VASPDELYRKPAAPAIADFLGRMNWLMGTIRGPDQVETEIGLIEAQTGALTGAVRIGLRPADIAISRTSSGQVNEFEARVSEEVFLGEHIELRLTLPGGAIDQCQAREPAPRACRRRERLFPLCRRGRARVPAAVSRRPGGVPTKNQIRT
jgi:ABC-type Fe3+/spermidine/putrescine transport system ATPase subunit